jgi:copper chaperone CopZ
MSETAGQNCCCEEKPVENRILLPAINNKDKEGSASAASRTEGFVCCCEEKVVGNEAPVTAISENNSKEEFETMTFKLEGLGCSCEGQIIEKKMKLLQGVKAFSLNPITNQIKVTFDPLAVSIPDIEKAVSKAGMKAVLIKSK